MPTKLRGPSQITRIPRLTSKVIRPTGPRVLHVAEIYVGGYGEPPAGFVVGQTSATEWVVYWALSKIFDDPKEPRKPPFYGGRDWSYQVPKGGKFIRAIGSAVVDFIVYTGNTAIAIRLVTEHFHIFTDSRKQASDAMQRVNLSSEDVVVMDLYDNEVLGDPSGQKAIIAVKRIIGLVEKINPMTSGTAMRASKMRVLNG